MESTTAFSVLMDLISVLGSFVTTPLFFGLSVINLLVLTFLFNMLIGLLLGGISPRYTANLIKGNKKDNN